MIYKEHYAVVILFLGLLSFSIWLQFGLLEPEKPELTELEKNDPDYYIENFDATGVDHIGKKYRIVADRLVHFPVRDRALLDNPHIIQYDLSATPSHVYADSGWLYNNRSTVLLTGNVRIVQSQTNTSGGGVATSEKLIIHLKDKRS